MSNKNPNKPSLKYAVNKLYMQYDILENAGKTEAFSSTTMD